MLELALAIVGLVVVVHNSPAARFLTVRPFSCGFCMSWWLAVGVAAAHYPAQEWLVLPFLSALAAALIARFAPELFRQG